jgi:hypothetical protein
MSTRTCRVAVFVTTVGLSICLPALAASAEVVSPVSPGVPFIPGGCSSTDVGSPSQSTGGTENQICQGGGGLVFVGPAVGQVATVVGPTIIGPSQVGTVVVSPGNVNVVW